MTARTVLITGASSGIGAVLSAQAVAETIRFALDQPASVDINTLVVRPIGQSL